MGSNNFLAVSKPYKSSKGYMARSQLSLNLHIIEFKMVEVQCLVPLTQKFLDCWTWPEVKALALVGYLTAAVLPHHPLQTSFSIF